MQQVEQEILAVDVVDVAVVSVSPASWPRIDEHKRVSAISEARLTLHDGRTLHHKRMTPAKVRMEFLVRNVAAFTSGTRVRILLGCRLAVILHLFPRLFLVLLLILLLLLRRLGLVLARRLHLILLRL